MIDSKRFAPAADRNRTPIWEALAPRLPESGRLLEIACGTGQHAVHFARQRPGLEILPTDPDPAAVASAEAHRAEAQLANLRPAHALDVRNRPWPVSGFDAVYAANMCHIAPWAATEALLLGAAEASSDRGRLFIYGPFLVDGAPTTESNAEFDRSLRARDPAWGIRDLADLDAVGRQAGLRRTETLPMPANNFLLVFER